MSPRLTSRAPPVASDPAARTDLLLESLRAAAIAGDPATHARILADLTTAGFSAGNLILAARCAGALESLGTQAPHKTADPAYATFVEEGRAGGIKLLTRLYPGPVGTGTGIPG